MYQTCFVFVAWSAFAAGVAAQETPTLTQDEAREGFVSLFDGRTLDGWEGDKENYVVEEGSLVCKKGRPKTLYTAKDYADFQFRFEFLQQPGTQGNNGIGIRCPPGGRWIEIQIFNNHHERSKTLKPYQFHGSVYGLVPAKQGHLKPAGQWNSQEILVQGRKIKVTLNGAVIVDADLDQLGPDAHPPAPRDKGRISFLGHGDRLEFRNLRVKEL